MPGRGAITEGEGEHMTETLVAVRHTGVLHTLDHTGDTRIMWDKGNEDEVATARKTFDDLRKKGYVAYRAEGKKGDRGEVIRAFDPDAERIILVKQLVGG
jgi:hypothetical protein